MSALVHGRASTYRNNAAVRAKGRAMTRLAAMYPNVLRRLEDEERAVEGLPPVGAVPPGRKPKEAS